MRSIPVGLVLVSLLLASCTSKSAAPQTTPAAGEQAGAKRTLNLAVWSNYLPDELLERFRKEHGIELKLSHYSSNEELLAKLQAGGAGYDVAFPSDYMVFALSQLKLVDPIHAEGIAGVKNIDPAFLGQAFDPKNEVSLPIHWGTTGLAYNRKLHPAPIRGWKDLIDSPAAKGRFTLLDDAREAIGVALKIQGHSLNTQDPAQLEQAKRLMIDISKRVHGFSSETKQSLIAGEVVAAQAYSSDALQAAQETHGDVVYVIPSEGATLWIDNMVMPKGAPHPAEAKELIEFMLQPENGGAAVAKLWLGTTNRQSMARLPEALRGHPGVFPDAATRKRLESMHDLGEGAALYDRLFTEIKAAR